MSNANIVISNVSKFYGEVLGVNHVNLEIPPGLTGLVGPNGSGKSTLMNLLTGLLRPSKGSVSILGVSPDDRERVFSELGYCTQYDSFPAGVTGFKFIVQTLLLHGYDRDESIDKAWHAIDAVGLRDAANRKVAGYSKGMRQRIKLAGSLCHEPQVLILDEPLNGLDPMSRAEIIDLFREFAAAGRHVIVSSHILHEVDMISDHIIMIHGGSVVAEGKIRDVRGEITNHPIQVLIRCTQPHIVASQAFVMDHVVEAKIIDEGILIRTRDANAFFTALNRIILDNKIEIETVMPSDESVHAVYDYLIGTEGASS